VTDLEDLDEELAGNEEEASDTAMVLPLFNNKQRGGGAMLRR
jgi:hypothetical protein